MGSPAESILAPIRQAAGRAGLTEFLRWWVGELSAMIPAGWRERFSASGITYISLEDDQWRVFRPAGGSLVEAGRTSLASLEGGERKAAFRRLVADSAGRATNVWLVLTRDSVLTRSVSLPLAAEEALRDAVGFELDRLTPLSPENACFDFRISGRDAVAQTITLDLAVTARPPVEGRLSKLRELGATVPGVGIEGDLATASAPFNLLAPEARERPATSQAAIAARSLALLAAILAVAALTYPLWQKREAVIELQPRLDRAKAGADVAERLAKEIEKLASEHNFLVSRKQAQYPAVLLLEDLSRLLPDTTWVQQLDIKAGPKVRELQIAGETGSSSQLVEVLERSGSLVNASFKSPLTKGVTPGTERFLLAAEVVPRALPEPMPEASLGAAGAPEPSVDGGVSQTSSGHSAPTPAVTVPAPVVAVPGAATAVGASPASAAGPTSPPAQAPTTGPVRPKAVEPVVPAKPAQAKD